jgi:hypothetical protein
MRLEEQAERLRVRARRAARVAEANAPAPGGQKAAVLEATTATRDVAIAALNELGVPSGPKAVADYAALRFGASLDSRAMASLRRGDQRSWRSTTSVRPVYIVPALEGHRFLPLRGKVALSSWPLRMRLIGPWSERADHLRATQNVARQIGWLAEARPEIAARMLPLLHRYANTVPGIRGNDAVAVESAAAAELALIDGPDLEWRGDAEERAVSVLDEAGYLWGAAPPRAVAHKVG